MTKPSTVLLCCLALAGCREGGPDQACDTDCLAFDVSALDQPPDPRWRNAPADLVVGDIEFIDPDGALDGKDLTVVAESVASLAGGVAGWSIEPSGELDSTIYARFTLPEPRTPGEELVLWTLDDDGWWTQSVGVVTDDGMHAVAGMIHFSSQALVSRDASREAFVAGVYCNGDQESAPAYRANQKNRTDLSESQINMPIGPASDRPTHVTMMERLTNLAETSAGEWMVFKNEERAGPSEACCWAGNPCRYPGVRGFEDEDYYGVSGLEEPLRSLGERVRTLSCGSLKIGVSEVFDTNDEHSANSLHYEGRAVDLFLITAEPSTWSTACGDDDLRRGRYALGLGRLAQLAADAGFGFTKYEFFSANRANNHVHASVSPSNDEPTPPAPLPPNTFEAQLILDDEIYEMSATEMPRGGRGAQLTLTATDFVDDAWTSIVLVLPDEQANGAFDVGGTSTLEVVRDGVESFATTGSITFEQVLPLEAKNYLTTTSGEFEVAVEGEAGSGTVQGRFVVDDLVFWGL